jgi:hypothetical protein
MFLTSDEIIRRRLSQAKTEKFMVHSTNQCQPLLNTLLGATRVAYFQSVTR